MNDDSGKIKVLIVDDDIALREVLKIMLVDFNVVEAENGEEAVRLYKMAKPDIVLMDIVMPKMNGVQATKEILKHDKNARILAITAYAKSKGEEMIEAGAKGVVSKPIKRRELIDMITKYVKG